MVENIIMVWNWLDGKIKGFGYDISQRFQIHCYAWAWENSSKELVAGLGIFCITVILVCLIYRGCGYAAIPLRLGASSLPVFVDRSDLVFWHQWKWDGGGWVLTRLNWFDKHAWIRTSEENGIGNAQWKGTHQSKVCAEELYLKELGVTVKC